MNPCEFRIAIVFSQQNRVFLLQFIKLFQNIFQFFSLLLNLTYTLRFKTVLLEAKQKCFLQSNKLRVIRVDILCKSTNSLFILFCYCVFTTDDFQFFFTDFAEIKCNILHCFIDKQFRGIITCKKFFLIYIINMMLHL